MRVSRARLDGDPRAYHSEEEIAALNKEKDMIAFLASRRAKQVATRTRRFQKKKNPKAGAGREVIYEKEPPDTQEKIRAARKRNGLIWQKYTNGKCITETEFQEMKKKDPKLNEGHSDALGGNKQS